MMLTYLTHPPLQFTNDGGDDDAEEVFIRKIYC